MEDITIHDLHKSEVINWLQSLTKLKASYFDYENIDELKILFEVAPKVTSVKFSYGYDINLEICLSERVTEIFMDLSNEPDLDLTPLLLHKKILTKATLYSCHIYNYDDLEPFLNDNSNTLKYLYLDIYGLMYDDYIKLINKLMSMNCSYELQMYYGEEEEDKVNELVRKYNATYKWSSGGYVGIIATLCYPQPKFLWLNIIKP